MRVMLDSNILVSAIVFNSKPMREIIQRLASKYSLVLCSFVISEVRTVFEKKFPKHINDLEYFLIETPFELAHTPQPLPEHGLFTIRDIDDENVLYSAILADVDVLITGDKHYFDGVDVERPEILTPAEFLNKY